MLSCFKAGNSEQILCQYTLDLIGFVKQTGKIIGKSRHNVDSEFKLPYISAGQISLLQVLGDFTLYFVIGQSRYEVK